MKNSAPSRVIVNLANYAHNLDVVRRLVGTHPGICAVVKANAYGHGMLPVARRAAEWGADMLGVATVDEGAALRGAAIPGPILLMFQPPREALAAAVSHDLEITLCDIESAKQLAEIARRLNKIVTVHCMIDTGMGRQGFALAQAAQDLQYVARLSRIDVAGIATHFPIAEKAEDTFTYNQIKALRQTLKYAAKAGIPFETGHAANSAAIVNYPGAAFDLVRPGLMTYGVWPALDAPAQRPVRPVMRWETRVIQVRELEPGTSISYGRTYTTDVRMRAAMLPVGYADGYPHHLSNRADVLLHGRRCPVRGRVCMDQIVVDVSHVPAVRAGDRATLLGADGDECITVEELALRADTIPYEILAGIGQRVAREYME
ncbi:MAG: alanine racemase [Candidatus Hydrogenedentota bacterium]